MMWGSVSFAQKWPQEILPSEEYLLLSYFEYITEPALSYSYLSKAVEWVLQLLPVFQRSVPLPE